MVTTMFDDAKFVKDPAPNVNMITNSYRTIIACVSCSITTPRKNPNDAPEIASITIIDSHVRKFVKDLSCISKK